MKEIRENEPEKKTAWLRVLFFTGISSFLAVSCASNPPPTAHAGTVQAVTFSGMLTQDQMTRLAQISPVTVQRLQSGQPLFIQDIKAMARVKVGSDVIITQIRNSGSTYHLAASEILDLKNAGVSDQVVDFMLNTPNSVAISGPSASPYPQGQQPPPPPVETEPPSPGPDYMWVGGDWAWNGGWVWSPGRWAIPPYPHAYWYHGAWRRPGFYRGRGYYWR